MRHSNMQFRIETLLCVTLVLLLIDPSFPLTQDEAEENLFKALANDPCNNQPPSSLPSMRGLLKVSEAAEKGCASAFESFRALPVSEKVRCPEAHTPQCRLVKDGPLSLSSRKCSVLLPTVYCGSYVEKPVPLAQCVKNIILRRQSTSKKKEKEEQRKKKMDDKNRLKAESKKKREEAEKARLERKKKVCPCKNCQGNIEPKGTATQQTGKNGNSKSINGNGSTSRGNGVLQVKEKTWCANCNCRRCYWARVQSFGTIKEPITRRTIRHADGSTEYSNF